MAEQMGLLEFFAMEASDYLERLDAVVSKGDGPDRDEFVRLTRALRGSALMANQQAFAAAAGGLERLARVVRDRSRPWDAATRQAAVRAVDDLKVLVRKVRSWTDVDTASAQRLTEGLQSLVGGAPRISGPAPARAPAAGERAFIAQQGASLASALEQAAGALAQNPLAQNPLQAVLRTMHPLRGIASLADHPPLPDLLEGIDRAVSELARHKEPVAGAADVLRAAARAVTATAREIATSGRANADAREAAEFAQRLGRLLGLDRDVVPIESLFYADAGPHVVQEGAPPSRPGKLGSLELVSHGEYLRQAADALERATSSVQRELRAHALVGTFRSLGSAGSGPLGSTLQTFAQLARDAVASGNAVRDPQGFAHWVREAGFVLSRAATDAEEALVRQLDGVTDGMRAGGGSGTAVPTPTAPRAPAEPQAAPHRPAAPSAAAVRQAAAGAEEIVGGLGLAAGYERYEQLATTLGLGNPSLAELLSGPPAAAPAPAPTAAVAAAPAAGGPQDVVPITQLCYSGDAAIARALSLRDRVRAALADATPDGAAVNDLIEEIFDLVQLGTGHTR